MDEKSLEKIKLQFEGGEETEIKKGFVAEIIEGKEAATITFHMAGMGGKDLTLLVLSVIQLGDRLGLFNGMEDGK